MYVQIAALAPCGGGCGGGGFGYGSSSSIFSFLPSFPKININLKFSGFF